MKRDDPRSRNRRSWRALRFPGPLRPSRGILPLAALLILSPAHAESLIEVALDTDVNATTGCSLNFTPGEPAGDQTGFEALLTLRVSQTDAIPRVVAAERTLCASGNWQASTSLTDTTWPVGLDNGESGSDAVEGFIPLDSIGSPESVRFAVLTTSDTGENDALVDQTTLDLVLLIPPAVSALSPLGMLMLAGGVLAGALVLGRHSRVQARLLLLALMMGARVVYAAGWAWDGSVADWMGIPPMASDPSQDVDDSAADILALYAARSDGNLVLRVDVRNLQSSGCSGAACGPGDLKVELIRGPIVLNASPGRALFGSLLLAGETLTATYQISPSIERGPGSLNDGKSLYFRRFDRDLQPLPDEQVAIDVFSTAPMNWDGDLGDHKLLIHAGSIYMVALVKGRNAPGFFEFDTDFELLNGPVYIGNENIDEERHPDMGFGTDGTSLFAQFFGQNSSENPADWEASIYRISLGLTEFSHAMVAMEDGHFVTGTSIVPVPAGQMGFGTNVLQGFSTNRDYGNTERVGIHTFTVESDLELRAGSTLDIVSRELDTYFPVGCVFNAKHQLWIVPYTMENFENEHGFAGAKELGPSFFEIMDTDFTSLARVWVNQGDPAFRVMAATTDDDVYIVYDEMDKDAWVEASDVKLEHYRIQRQ